MAAPRHLLVLTLAVSCGPASKHHDAEPEPNAGDETPESACQPPCRVVVGDLKRPAELVADSSSVYFAERGDGDSFDAAVMRAPEQGGAAVKLATAPSMVGLFLGGANLFWRTLGTATASDGSSIEMMSAAGGTPTRLFESPTSIGVAVADDTGVYAATLDEVFSIAIDTGKKTTFGKVVGVSSLALNDPDLILVDRGRETPTQAELDDPAATRPCLVDWVRKAGGTLETAYTAPPVPYANNCNPTSIAPYEGGVVWLGPSITGEGTALFKLPVSATMPVELATGLSSDYGELTTDADSVYFTYRTQADDTVFARYSRTHEVTTLWSGPVHPGGMAASGGSLYFTAFETSEDGKRTHGAVLAIPIP